ncbi:hypothetical protein [Bdellovibrio bacteriovorus]|uniref:DUF333 domain-containing protein n=1 Tax=Bdellovibrio bacteriovorus TaxID=959 RepID=A0A150WE57_BDEBC|nr:hypothetical protein [Bdellovibrio bacteriovorus]KYG61253.1 hypothetical protein AZI85_09950 [Bdellovibrio bacteriovorus]
MMKVFLLSITMIFAGLTAQAANNPWMRTCRIDQGQFWTIKVGSDEQALCLFGDASIGAETFFLFKTNAGVGDAIDAYKHRKSSSPRGGVCGAFDAELIEGKDTSGRTFNICRFDDGSLIEETTLWLGAGSGSNEALDRALSKTY